MHAGVRKPIVASGETIGAALDVESSNADRVSRQSVRQHRVGRSVVKPRFSSRFIQAAREYISIHRQVAYVLHALFF